MYMASLLVIFLSSIVLIIFTVGRAQTVPAAVYVFGDSLVDVGNNNYIPLTLIKADFPHNGIDFPGHKSTGRFCNGKNAADFLGEKVGLPTAPPYLSQPKNSFLKGVNFASGGAGIFNTPDTKRVISMDKQVEYFAGVGQRLVEEMGSTPPVQQHLSKSLFPIVIGSNDIIDFFSNGTALRKTNTPQQYVNLMIATLKQQLKSIYGVGGRKFLIIGLSPIGCAPKQRHQIAANACNEEVNYWSKKYNEGLTQMLPELQSELKDFHYSYFDIYTLFLEFVQNPTTYGFTEVKSACCGLGKLRAGVPCTPLSLYCPDRSSHLFWDIYHPTEAAARMFVDKLFDASATYASPITLQQLITL
ncbi:hypothetical protein ACS0TY_032720 [Phlomoides rotata]